MTSGIIIIAAAAAAAPLSLKNAAARYNRNRIPVRPTICPNLINIARKFELAFEYARVGQRLELESKHAGSWTTRNLSTPRNLQPIKCAAFRGCRDIIAANG
jgi:hypothetical protein